MSPGFWLIVAGTILGILLAVLVVMLISLVKFRQNVSQWLDKVKSIELITLLNKLTWRDYFESNLRAATGKTVSRPFGTNLHFFQWNQFQFNPVYLTREPLASDIPITTEVILGPQAKKPLSLKIPIINAGMSYGSSLSFKAKMALAKAATMAGTAAN